MVFPLDDRPFARPILVGDQQAHRSLHLQKARSRYGQQLVESSLQKRLAQAQGVQKLVDHVHQVVLCVVLDLGRYGPGVEQHMLALLGHESKGVAYHLGQIVPHQQGFVFIDGQTGMALVGCQADVNAAVDDLIALSRAREAGQTNQGGYL